MRILIGIIAGIGLALLLLKTGAIPPPIKSWLIPGSEETEAASEGSGKKEPLYWVAPMDPNYRRDQPGKSPMGMDLVPVYEEQTAEGSVTISPTVQHNLGLKLAAVEQRVISRPVVSAGYIRFDEGRLEHIHSRVSGWVEKLHVESSGDSVEKDQVLLELYSPDLVTAQEEYVAALASGNRMLTRAAVNKLKALGVENAFLDRLKRSRKVRQTIPFMANQSGVVAQLNVRPGMYVTPNTEIISVGSLDSVWVEAQLLERQATSVQEGQPVTIKVDALAGASYQGQVDYLYPTVDPKTRTLSVRIRLENPGQRLKPNMFVLVQIDTSEDKQVVAVPRDAVITTGIGDRVIKKLDDSSFQVQAVSVGKQGERFVEITNGLQQGEQVVISGQFLIDSESNVSAELLKLQAAKNNVPEVVTVTGSFVEKVSANQIKIRHDPVPEWSWPAMTMVFSVSAQAHTQARDQDALAQGQSLEFQLRRESDSEYLITSFSNVQKHGTAGNINTSVSTSGESGSAGVKQVATTGFVKEVMADMEMIEITHDPIPEWKWPKMTMVFETSGEQNLQKLQAGQHVRFLLQETPEGEYLATEIQPINNGESQ